VSDKNKKTSSFIYKINSLPYSSVGSLDLILQISDKTAMNYLHNLTKIEVDFPLAPAL
jgi:hypothetical protein